MENKKPCVSLGLPVFNGENYLEAALDSILAQTFTDFEVIISDNASTDRTPEISLAYARKDARIRYYRHKKNRGAAWNFNRAFELSSGRYFKWVAHDDIIAPDYLSKCIEVLDMDDSVVLCNSRVQIIDEHGDVIATYVLKLNNAISPNPSDRFGDLISLRHYCYDVFGLIRSDALRKTSLIKAFIDSDRALLIELSLLGKFYEIPQYLFFNRDHAERFTKIYPKIHFRAGWFDPLKEGQITFWRWRILFESFKSIHHFSPGFYDKACCYKQMGKWLWFNHRSMMGELIFFVKYSLNSILARKKKIIPKNMVR